MKRLLTVIVAVICLSFAMPAVAAELNLGGGTPLWDTHTDDDTTGLDGGYLIYASIDRVKKDSKWLSYGLMYNYTRMELKWEKTSTEEYWDIRKCDQFREDCYPIYDTGAPVDYPGPTTVTTTTHYEDWLNVHVLGPYVKPFYKIGDRVKLFGMIGVGGMYVDGAIYGDEFGPAGFASAGLSLDITEHLGMGAQILYVKGYTNHVDDIDYLAPVATLSYRW